MQHTSDGVPLKDRFKKNEKYGQLLHYRRNGSVFVAYLFAIHVTLAHSLRSLLSAYPSLSKIPNTVVWTFLGAM